MQAYSEAISKTSTTYSPWYVIPANHNWYRDLVIAKIITKTLDNLKMSYPPPIENLESYKASLLAE